MSASMPKGRPKRVRHRPSLTGRKEQNRLQSKRAARLQQMRKYSAKRQSSESAESRAARLQRKRQYAAERLALESEESRAARLQQKREHAAEKLALESEKDRMIRLQKMRENNSKIRGSLRENINTVFVKICESTEEIRNKIAAKIYTVNPKEGRGKLWQVFGRIETDKGETIESYVSCKKCFRILKFNKSSTANLIKHKCYVVMNIEAEKNAAQIRANIEPETKKNLERIILQWSIENNRSIDVIEDSGLQKLAEFLVATGAKYGSRIGMEHLMPQPVELLQNVPRLHADYSAKLKNQLESIRNVGYGLTTDVWSDDYLWTTYIFLTIHYIKNGELINRFLGMKSFEGDECTIDDIKLVTAEILQNFDCNLDDKPIVVTEKSENMMEAFQSSERIYCINHLLQRALEEAIDNTPDVRDICKTVAKLCNFLKNIDHKFACSVEVGSTKRWNTVFHMMTLIEANWNEAVKISRSHTGEESQIIESLSLEHLTELQTFLEPFEEASKEMECSSSPTLHLVLVHTDRLMKLCVKNLDDLDVIKNFKFNLLHSFDKFVRQNMTLKHKVALYLFPPANKLISFSQAEKNEIRDECKRIMQSYIEEEEAPDSPTAYSAIQFDDKQVILDYLNEMNAEEENEASTSTNTIKHPDIFEEFVEIKRDIDTAAGKVNNEIRLYEDTNIVMHDNFNLLQWWHLHQTQFPLLYKTCCKILAVPASAVMTKEAIMKARPLIFENRSAADVNEILFLHYNVEQNEMFEGIVIN